MGPAWVQVNVWNCPFNWGREDPTGRKIRA